MSMSDLEQASELVSGLNDADFLGPQAEPLVLLGEKTLGLVFPPTYREFLRRFGSGGVPGYEFYGLVNDDFESSGVPDAIWLTLHYRKSMRIPSSLILVCDTGDGGYYAIDTSQKTAEGDSPIVEWWPGIEDAQGHGRTIACDFGAFFLERVRWAMEDAQ